MKKYFPLLLSIAAVALHLSIKAQKQWTLEDCIRYGLENSLHLSQEKFNCQIASLRYNAVKRMWYPEVNANFTEYLGIGQSPSSNGIYISDNSYNSIASISASMPFLRFHYIGNKIKSSKINLKSVLEDFETLKFNLSAEILNLYVQAIICKELKNLSVNKLNLSLKQYDAIKESALLGKFSLADVYEAYSQVVKAEVSLEEATNNLFLSILELKHILSMDSAFNFDTVSPEEFEKEASDTVLSEEYSINDDNEMFIINFPSQESARLRLNKALIDLKVLKSEYYPSFNFNFSFSDAYYNYFSNNYENISLKPQIISNARAQISLSLNIPIINSISAKHQIGLAELNIKKQELCNKIEELQLQKDFRVAHNNVYAALQKYKLSTKYYEAKKISYNCVNEGFKSGRKTFFELSEIKNGLYQAETDMLYAKYEYIYRSKMFGLYKIYEKK